MTSPPSPNRRLLAAENLLGGTVGIRTFLLNIKIYWAPKYLPLCKSKKGQLNGSTILTYYPYIFILLARKILSRGQWSFASLPPQVPPLLGLIKVRGWLTLAIMPAVLAVAGLQILVMLGARFSRANAWLIGNIPALSRTNIMDHVKLPLPFLFHHLGVRVVCTVTLPQRLATKRTPFGIAILWSVRLSSTHRTNIVSH